MREEVWKQVPGYEGLYEVSSLGRVRSLDRSKVRGGQRKGKVLKPRSVSRGYKQVTLCNGKTKKQTLVHRVVCEAFHGKPPTPKHQVDHINKDRSDNRADNLEWVTCKENIRRAGVRWGKFKPVIRIEPDGSEHWYRGEKFAIADGYSGSEIYRCVSGQRKTVNGRTWRFAGTSDNSSKSRQGGDDGNEAR